ncbi:NAD(P)-binding protein [Daedaleopsis nitida]|nr:NAD(P)-binding protein [Daedaleopsis nitida]
MSTAKTYIFITAPPCAGYIGSTVITKLVNHPKAATFDIYALVRSAEKAKVLESTLKSRVKAVVGSHQDLDKVQALAEKADVVFHIGDADDVSLIKAILAGMKAKHAKTGVQPILIHTSGTAILIDDARGEYAAEKVYSDLDAADIRGIPETALHRNVDLLVFEADAAGYARTHIVCPCTIYGLARNPLVEAGIANAHSIQVPILVKAALAGKKAGVIGQGKSIWTSVHVEDVADLYITLYDSIMANPATIGHGWDGLYFAENGEHTWLQLGEAVASALVAQGVAEPASAGPATYTLEEMKRYFGSEQWGWLFGTNCRSRADRARAIGWRPKYTTEDLMKSIEPEVASFLKQ